MVAVVEWSEEGLAVCLVGTLDEIIAQADSTVQKQRRFGWIRNSPYNLQAYGGKGFKHTVARLSTGLGIVKPVVGAKGPRGFNGHLALARGVCLCAHDKPRQSIVTAGQRHAFFTGPGWSEQGIRRGLYPLLQTISFP